MRFEEFEQLKERCRQLHRSIELRSGDAGKAETWMQKHRHAMTRLPDMSEVMFRVEDTEETTIDVLFKGQGKGQNNPFCILARYYRPGGWTEAYSAMGRDSACIYDHCYSASQNA